MRWFHCPAHVSRHCRSWLSRLRQGHTSAAKQVQRGNKVNVHFSFSDSTDLICVTYCSPTVHTLGRQCKFHHWVILLSLNYIQTFWPCLYPATRWKDHEDYKGKLGSYKQTSILSIISFDLADIIHWTVSIFNLGLFGGVKWPPLNTRWLVLMLQVVPPSDLWCENCKEGLNVCGLDPMTVWLISYTPEGDSFSNEMGFWWEGFFPVPQPLDQGWYGNKAAMFSVSGSSGASRYDPYESSRGMIFKGLLFVDKI